MKLVGGGVFFYFSQVFQLFLSIIVLRVVPSDDINCWILYFCCRFTILQLLVQNKQTKKRYEAVSARAHIIVILSYLINPLAIRLLVVSSCGDCEIHERAKLRGYVGGARDTRAVSSRQAIFTRAWACISSELNRPNQETS